jgi:hypothetical protein
MTDLKADILSIQSSSLLLYKSFLSVVNPDNIGIIESKSIVIDLCLEDDDKSYMSISVRIPNRVRQSNSNSVSSSQMSTPKTPTVLVETTITKRTEEDGRIKAGYTGSIGLKPIFGATARYLLLVLKYVQIIQINNNLHIIDKIRKLPKLFCKKNDQRKLTKQPIATMIC